MGRPKTKKLGGGEEEVVLDEKPVKEKPVKETTTKEPMRPNSDYLEFGIIA